MSSPCRIPPARPRSSSGVVVLFLLVALMGACTTRPAESPLRALEREARGSADSEIAGRWLLGELVSPGGTPERARAARSQLDRVGGAGMYASLARGLDDGLHGRLSTASDRYLEAVRAARGSQDELAPLVAWFAVHRALESGGAATLWKRWQPDVQSWTNDPRALGWRARGELAEWLLDQAWASGTRDVDSLATKLYGCLTRGRIAGPFGHGAAVDASRHFAPERPGVWPERWDPDPTVSRAPRAWNVEEKSCALGSDDRDEKAIHYAETFFELDRDQDVLLAARGALALFVDDFPVLDRDPRIWGIWPKFGVALRLSAGRHRVVARLSEPTTSFRLLRPDGTPLGVEASHDESPGYSVTPPVVGPDPNVLSRWIRRDAPSDPSTHVARYLAAALAHVESSDDVASVLLEPLVLDTARATGPALSLSASLVEGDPIYEQGQAKDLARDLSERAVKKDRGLWASRLSLAIGLAERKGAAEAVPDLQRLTAEFPEVPQIPLTLSRVYGQLDWNVEHVRTAKDLVRRFPDDLGALHVGVEVFTVEGDTAKVDDLLARIARLDPDSEVTLLRAQARQDYATALSELGRIAKIHGTSDELEDRIAELKIQAGSLEEAEKRVRKAVVARPTNARARLELADLELAAGQADALHRGLAGSVEAGASREPIASAIDLVEGLTDLAPYRLDTRSIIGEYEKSGRTMPGTAARILDYSALWIRADGSSRMLEHEIVRVQSAEAISSFAEHRMLEGLVLHLRVLKKDGTTFEPEFVQGKPTVTFPHLEVGDYIETEQVVFAPGDGSGVRYNGPRWFFREENVGYARSEFVVIAPESKELVVETTGAVPAPVVEKKNGLVSRRFRVDVSPAAAQEPGSPPAAEFLPSVRIGWGVTLKDRIQDLSDAMTPMTPIDPRVERIARRVVAGSPPRDPILRARKLYRWLLDNVEPGEETDARRIIVGKRGNLWNGFRALCQAVAIDVRYAVAKNRLAPPPAGPLSLATHFTSPVAHVRGGKDGAWLTLGNKYAPFGYLPAEVRGMPAYWLDGVTRAQVTLPSLGGADAISFSGRGKLAADGSLTIDLVEEFSGKLATALRQGLSQVPEKQLNTVIESNLLAQAIRGAELVKVTIERREDLDSSLVVRMRAKVPQFASRSGSTLVISPPMMPALGRLATLPSRKNPLLLAEGVHRKVSLTIELPKKARVEAREPVDLSDGGRRITVSDSGRRGVLRVERTIELPPGRVQPADYPQFARFVQEADDALQQAIRIRL